MKELSPNTQLADPKSAKKSRTFPHKNKSPSKTASLLSTWKETGKPTSNTMAASSTTTTSDFTLEKEIKQEQFQQQLQQPVAVNPLEVMLEDNILLTPETFMQPSIQLPKQSSFVGSELDSEPTKQSKTTNILELLAKKDNLKKISQSVEQFQQPIPKMSTVPTTTSTLPATPQKKKSNQPNPNTTARNNSPPRAPSPPTKQPAASKNNNYRTTSPPKSPTSTSSTGITANNNSSSTNTSELRFAGAAFHNSPAPSELPIPVDFFSGKNKDASGTTVKMPSNPSNVTLISGAHSPPTRDIPTHHLPNNDAADSVKVNFNKLPEFQSRPSFPFPMMPAAPPMHGSWPQMMQMHPLMVPTQPPIMLDQMSSQLKMMLNIAS